MDRAKKRVLFICTHNSARSQMAEAFLRAMCGDRFEAYSAGTEPTRVDPLVVEVMNEVGLDISGQRAKGLDPFLGKEFDYIVTVCDNAKRSCPFFPGGRQYLHKSFEDPATYVGTPEARKKALRQLRDQIRDWVFLAFCLSSAGGGGS